jgi:hypothetical protein
METAAFFRKIQRRARAEHEKTSRPGRQKRIISCSILRISSKTLSSMVLSALIYCLPAYPTHPSPRWHARPPHRFPDSAVSNSRALLGSTRQATLLLSSISTRLGHRTPASSRALAASIKHAFPSSFSRPNSKQELTINFSPVEGIWKAKVHL